jgi:hypothetical protein
MNDDAVVAGERECHNRRHPMRRKGRERRGEREEKATHRTSDALQKIGRSNIAVDQQVKH